MLLTVQNQVKQEKGIKKKTNKKKNKQTHSHTLMCYTVVIQYVNMFVSGLIILHKKREVMTLG